MISVVIPANIMYDSARAIIAKGLTAGGLRILWDQFPTGKFPPLPYDAFKVVFGHGWERYDIWNPPTSNLKRLRRPEAKAKKAPSLSFAYSEANNVSKYFLCACISALLNPLYFECRCHTRRFVFLQALTSFKPGATSVLYFRPILPFLGARSVCTAGLAR